MCDPRYEKEAGSKGREKGTSCLLLGEGSLYPREQSAWNLINKANKWCNLEKIAAKWGLK